MNLFGWESGLLLAVLATVLGPAPAHADLPHGLPLYDVAMDLDLAGHTAHVVQCSTWTNLGCTATQHLVFNAHSHYVVPAKDLPLTAKTLEILRVDPSEGLGYKEPPCEIVAVTLPTTGPAPVKLPWHFEGDTNTTLVVDLPRLVQPGESITVHVELVMHLPQKQGRWGQWRGVTFLSNWLPVFAFYGPPPPPKDDDCDKPAPGYEPAWQPTPFVPWHQPFFNEAGSYHALVRLPADQKIACTGTMVNRRPLDQGKVEVEIQAPPVRDFAFLCSACYNQYDGEAKVCDGRPPVRVHVLALPQHEHYGRESLRIAIHALETYSRWFGPYPYQDFTVAESYFGWNGNECATLIMIDERVFGMPHLGGSYVEYLVSHETCHQWWYNVVGTNGYHETFMDEAPATFFSNKVVDECLGKHNALMKYPDNLQWMPNINRDDYRVYGMYGTIARGEIGPPIQDLPAHGHVVNLFSNCYDKGSRILGMIEERLGEAGFKQFFRRLFCKYQYRILRVTDFQHELEEFTGQSWETFFHDWLYGKGLVDWAVKDVVVQPPPTVAQPPLFAGWRAKRAGPPTLENPQGLTRVTVFLDQKAEINEATTLAIDLKGADGHSIRVPIVPQREDYRIDEPPASVEHLEGNCLRVEVLVCGEPAQVTVDPDHILIDKCPFNNYWQPPIRFRFSPVYTFLEETDITCAYDRWNVMFGPYIYGASYNSPWYTRATMIGGRVGAYRTEDFAGGAYLAYRTDFRDIVAGVDGLWDHFPDTHFQVGFNYEKRVEAFETPADNSAQRGAVYLRDVFQYGSSMYLAPINYLEAYGSYEDNFLPFSSYHVAGAERFDHASTMGLHYQLNYLTPYWDSEAGILFNVAYAAGVANLTPEQFANNPLNPGGERGMQVLTSQLSGAYPLPNLCPLLDGLPDLQGWARPFTDWVAATKFAMQVYGCTGLPTRGEFFSLGGSQQFRGFDLSDRQGSSIWGANFELRVPVAQGLTCDYCDHIVGVRNVYTALFCDVGDAYLNGHSEGPMAEALGAGLRVDVAWFSFVERTILRLDVAKCINENTPWQFWIGFQHPF